MNRDRNRRTQLPKHCYHIHSGSVVCLKEQFYSSVKRSKRECSQLGLLVKQTLRWRSSEENAFEMSWGRKEKEKKGSRIGLRRKLSLLTSEDGMTFQRSPQVRQEYWFQTTLGRV